MLDGVVNLHKIAGCVHNDICSDNILINLDDNNVVIIDLDLGGICGQYGLLPRVSPSSKLNDEIEIPSIILNTKREAFDVWLTAYTIIKIYLLCNKERPRFEIFQDLLIKNKILVMDIKDPNKLCNIIEGKEILKDVEKLKNIIF